jgi:hypothetical protein
MQCKPIDPAGPSEMHESLETVMSAIYALRPRRIIGIFVRRRLSPASVSGGVGRSGRFQWLPIGHSLTQVDKVDFSLESLARRQSCARAD